MTTSGLTLAITALRRQIGGEVIEIGSSDDAADAHAALEVGARNKVLQHVSAALLPALSLTDQEFCRNYRLASITNNAALLRETESVSQHLSANNIAHLLIKGPLQSQIIYGDFAHRPASDIDILVSRRDYSSTIAVLGAIGYSAATTSLWWRAFLGEQHLQKPGPRPLTVDLHYRLQQPGSPPPRDLSRFLASPGYSSVLDAKIPRLADADMPLLSAISIVKALFNREHCGAHVCDLFFQLKADTHEALDDFLAKADEQDLRGTALLALRIVSATFGVTYPVAAELAAVLPEIGDEQLIAMAFTPQDATIVWPRRRAVLWALCLHRPVPYLRELARSLASETALRLFERGPSADATKATA